MKLTILGSGSPEAYARRASSGYLIETGDQRILFDCGGGVFDNLLRAGLLPSDIDVLIFSHLHTDHMMDYARLVHAAWDESAAPLVVYGPPPIAAITEGYFGPNGVLSHDLRARTEFGPSQEVWQARGGTLPRPWPAPEVHEVQPGFSLTGDGWELQSCEVPHAQPHLTCMGFRFSAEDKVFAYSGDAGLCQGFRDLAEGADLLLHWCYRLDGEKFTAKMDALSPTPGEVAAMASDIGAKRLVLSHFRKHMDGEGCHEAALAQMTAAFDGPSSIAEDLQVFEI